VSAFSVLLWGGGEEKEEEDRERERRGRRRKKERKKIHCINLFYPIYLFKVVKVRQNILCVKTLQLRA